MLLSLCRSIRKSLYVHRSEAVIRMSGKTAVLTKPFSLVTVAIKDVSKRHNGSSDLEDFLNFLLCCVVWQISYEHNFADSLPLRHSQRSAPSVSARLVGRLEQDKASSLKSKMQVVSTPTDALTS